MSICFTINRKEYKVRLGEYPADITLNTFIRDCAQLSGTKFMCLEGGCGCCTVTINRLHPVAKEYFTGAANSCLIMLYVCDGWDIITIEGLGDKLTGYHPIQERLAHMSGSQCGYCSPGMVMNMYGLLEAKGGYLTLDEVENSFDGNLCRCTGYRPILDAMKSFARNSEFDNIDLCKDIEDLGRECPRTNMNCRMNCPKKTSNFTYNDGHIWYFPNNLHEVFTALEEIDEKNYMLVAGNTGHGVYRRDESICAFINVNNVPELHMHYIGDSIELGGNITLSETINILTEASIHHGFEYCSKIVDHLKRIANTPVRNIGTLAGNLMLKHKHNEFPSDIFLLLTTINAQIYVRNYVGEDKIMSPPDFLQYNMYKNVILKIYLPALDQSEILLETYKITPRAQNAHAYVNAGFYLHHLHNQIIDANICFGGINPHFIQAISTSNYLLGQSWINMEILHETLSILSKELQPNWILPDSSPAFRKLLALGLFYKFVLKTAPAYLVPAEFRTGGYLITRPLSSSVQKYETKKENWPLTQPVLKLDILEQCSGEAVYMNDLPKLPEQLWAAFVHATETNATVAQIDPSEALKIHGVVAFYSAKDIAGVNSFVVPLTFSDIIEDEEIFCKGRVKYHSQPVGIIVAETLDLANLASKKVKITYERTEIAKVCNFKDVLESKISDHNNGIKYDSCENNSISATVEKVKGNFEVGGQYHFSMETQTTICIPNEKEINVFCATQYLDLIQSAMARALNIKENKINLFVKRLGGGFGAKATRPGQIAIACALACIKLNRPIRFVQSLESNMAVIGKRCPCICNYDIDVDQRGVIQRFSLNYYSDLGCSNNGNLIKYTTPIIQNCYTNNGWIINGQPALTDAPSNTWCRAAGSIEGIAMIENIMEHISRVVNRDPVDVRLDNIPNDSKMKRLLPEFIESTSYRDRKNEINKFNKENRWRKKGISICILKYPIIYFGTFSATVTVYHNDGTVAISHGAIEMGQGLNTKLAQVAAFTLGIPLDMITVKPTTSMNGANSFGTVASIGSDSVCSAVRGACQILLERMAIAKSDLKNPTWVEITRKCYQLNINLIASHMYKVGDLIGYDVWGLACAEVEVDILTGNCQLNRVDILEDTGESLSPLIDVGQIEGAYIMGVGYWLTEKLIYDRQTGKLLTNRTWHYKVPGAKDIPVDFRVTLHQKEPNPTGLLRSKTTGEPATCLAFGTISAIRYALDSARFDSNVTGWYSLGAPTTPEDILLNAGHDVKTHFTLKK